MLRFLAGLIVLFSNPYVAYAQQRIGTTVDTSFTLESLGPKSVFDGVELFPVVTLHRVLIHKGRAYACAAYGFPVNLHKQFIDDAKLKTSDGTVFKQGFRHATPLKDAPQVFERRKDRIARKRRGAQLYPSNINFYVGLPVTCIRTQVKQGDPLLKQKTTLEIPNSIRVTIN